MTLSPYVLLGQMLPSFLNNIDLGDTYSDVQISCICEDSLGFIWLGTNDGLLKYDGLSVESFKHNNNNSISISNNNITSVYTDKSGTLWIGTKEGGLNKFKNGIFYHYPRGNNPQITAEKEWIKDILEDTYGNLWIAYNGSGLALFDRETDEFSVFRTDSTDNSSISGDAVTCLYENSTKDLYIGTFDGGVCKLVDIKNGHFIRIKHPKHQYSKHVIAIAEDAMGTLWVGTFGGGLQFLEVNNLKLTQDTLFALDYQISDLKYKNQLLVGSWGQGVIVYNTITKKIIPNIESPKREIVQRHKNIVKIFIDSEQHIYISSKNGLGRLDTFTTKFNTNTYTPTTTLYGEPIEIKSFEQLNDSNIIISTEKGIRIFNHHTKHFNTKLETLFNKHLVNCMVNQVVVTDSELIIATREKGTIIINKKGVLIKSINSERSKNSSGFSTQASRIIKDENKLLIADNALWEYDLINNNKRMISGVIGDVATSMIDDNDGNIWLGYWTNGVRKTHIDSIGKRYNYSALNPFSLPNSSVYCILQDKLGVMWLGTGFGLCKYLPNRDGFETVKLIKGLENIKIMSIIEIGNSLWMGTSYGILLYNKISAKAILFDKSSGLPDLDFVYNSAFKSHSGELFFGAKSGFIHFNPSSIPFNLTPPKIYIDGVYLSCNKRIIIDKNHTYTIDKDGDFCIKMRVLDLSIPDKNRYSYMLEGHDTAWIDNGYNPIASYSNVPKGHYTFLFKGANSDYIWSIDSAKVNIDISNRNLMFLWILPLAVLIIISIFYYKKIRINKITPKYATSSLSAKEINKYIKALEEYMSNKKPHLKGKVYLKDVADILGFNANYLSQAINKKLQKNFFDFVNEYRVEEAKKLLENSDDLKLNLLGICFESGFNSKTSFYTVFKKHTGTTPSKYSKMTKNKPTTNK